MIRIYEGLDFPDYSKRGDSSDDVSGVVSEIISRVRREGDTALRRYAKRFEGAELQSLEVAREELDAALEEVEPSLLDIMREAAANITAFHEKQKRQGFVMDE